MKSPRTRLAVFLLFLAFVTPSSRVLAQPATWVGTVAPFMDATKTDSYMVSRESRKNLWGGDLFAAAGTNLSKTIVSFPGANVDVVMQQCFGGGFVPGLAAAIPKAPVGKNGYTLTAATNWNEFGLNTPTNPVSNFTSSWNQALSTQDGSAMLNHYLDARNGTHGVTADPYGPNGASRNLAKGWFENPTYASPDALAEGKPDPVGFNNRREVITLNQFAVLIAPDPTGAGNERFALNIDRIYTTLTRNIKILARDIVVLYGTNAKGTKTDGGTPINGPASVENIEAAMAGKLFGDTPNSDAHLFVYSTGHGDSWTKPGGTTVANAGSATVKVRPKPSNGFTDSAGSPSDVGVVGFELAFPRHVSPAGVSIRYNGVTLTNRIIDESSAPMTDLSEMIGTAFYWEVDIPFSMINQFRSLSEDTITIDGLSTGSAAVSAVTYNDAEGDAWSVAIEPEAPARTGDKFGNAISASCDFNGDGFDDLAIGAPGEDVGSIVEAGAVHIVYGGPGRLTATGNQFFNEDSPDIEGFAEAGDHFGAALAGGDFDHDGFCDLAIGIPGEDVGSVVDAGAVKVLYGGPSGLSGSRDQVWDQNSAEGDIAAVEGVAEEGDLFGSALAAGDFNGDGFVDLAIGVPGEDVGSRVDAGAVNVLYGTASGLSAVKDQLWNQNSSSVPDFCERGDRFGSALASGDFNGDGFADLAIGVPGEDIGTIVDAGAVNVLYGTATRGLYGSGAQIWDQNKAGIEGVCNPVGSSRVDLQACKLEYSIVSPK